MRLRREPESMNGKSNALKPFMPKEEYMWPAWVGCLHWALGEEGIMEAFRRDTGNHWKPATSAIGIMIDEGCGAPEKFIVEFAKWMNENIWGDVNGDNDAS